MTKHTPGPWRARISGDPDVLTSSGDLICAVYTDDLAEADARLIAAAPEMLAALREAASTLPVAGRMRPDDLAAIQRIVLDAIAKATGR